VIVRIITYEKENPYEQRKVYWLDVHQATIVVAVTDSSGKLIMESILETEAATILQFFAGLRGNLSVTFEEGTWSAWLYDLLNPHVEKLVVCNPRKNALLKDGNKSDRIDARKLAELLRGNQLKPVYHGENGVRMLRELSRSYLTIVKDLSRVMNRLKAVYRSWAIPCAGRDVYYRRHRAQWLDKIREAGERRRAERLYEQLDMLQHSRQQARRELLAESRKHAITARLRQIPYLGPIRSALAVALMQTPYRFRTKRQLWAYSGLALETRISAEYRMVEGQVRRSKKLLSIRGLNKDHNHDLKGLFKGAATMASVRPGPFQDFYQASLAKGIKPTTAHTSAQDRSHYADSMEEGRKLRRRKTEIASRLSVSGEEPFHLR
jgi:transposase